MGSRRDKMTGPGHGQGDPLIVAAIHFIFLAVTLLHQEGIHGKAINSFAGPYTIYTDRFYNCEGQYSWMWNLRTSHFNPQKPLELQLITGNISGDTFMTDKSWMHWFMDTRSNNEWKENAFVAEFKDKACQMLLANIPGFVEVFFGKIKGPCVVKPGFYSANQTPIDWTFPKFPIMPYGHYKFRLKVGNAKDTVACFAVHCHVIPKSK